MIQKKYKQICRNFFLLAPCERRRVCSRLPPVSPKASHFKSSSSSDTHVTCIRVSLSHFRWIETVTFSCLVRDLVCSDRRIQVKEIAQVLGISHGSVSTILHDRLGMRKLTARWVPKSLGDEQMATRTAVCFVEAF